MKRILVSIFLLHFLCQSFGQKTEKVISENDTLDFKQLTNIVILYNIEYIESEFYSPNVKSHYLVFDPSGSPGFSKFSDTIKGVFVENMTSQEIVNFYKNKRKKQRGFLCFFIQDVKYIKDVIEIKYFFSIPFYEKKTKKLTYGELSIVRVKVKFKEGNWIIQDFIREY